MKRLVLGLIVLSSLAFSAEVTREYWSGNTHIWNITCSNGKKIEVAKSSGSSYTVYDKTNGYSKKSQSSLQKAVNEGCN